MKKNTVLIFTRILYVLTVIGTIISLFIVYKDIDSIFAIRFLMGFLYFVLFMILYVLSITFINLRKFQGAEIRKILIKFIVLFISFGVLNYVFDYFFRPSNINFFREFSVALGLSFGITFIDATFLKSKVD
jgi:tryptophan-rich sensory protein